MGLIDSLIGLGTSATTGAINGLYTDILNERNAWRQNKYWQQQATQTFKLNEKSADNAMQRQMQLYNQLQSPQAIKQQLLDAGLNPALLYSQGGMGGQVASAPQGAAAQPQGVQTFGLQQLIDPLTSAQIANINADTKKKENESDNISQDTKLKQAIEENTKANTLWTQIRSEIDNNNLTISNETIQDQITQIKTKTYEALEELEEKRLNNSITKDTYEEQVGKIKQEFANSVTQGLIMQEEINKIKAVTDNVKWDTEQKKAEIKKINRETELMRYKIFETINNTNLARVKTMTEQEQQQYLKTLKENIVNEFEAKYGWNTFTKEDAFRIGEGVVDAVGTAFGISSGSALIGQGHKVVKGFKP